MSWDSPCRRSQRHSAPPNGRPPAVLLFLLRLSVFLPRFQLLSEEIFHEATHSTAGLPLHVRGDMGVGVQGKGCVGMTQDAGQGLGVHTAGEGVGGEGVPLRYNNDKPEKPRNFKGLEVYQADFSSFSNPKNQATKPLFRRGC